MDRIVSRVDTMARPSRPGSMNDQTTKVTGWRRVGYLALAGLFFVLGALGLVLPVLPTTPFLLLTSYFLIRSHPGLNERLVQSRLFGPILRDWHTHRGVRRHVKVKTVALVLLVLALSLYLGQLSFGLKIGVVALVGVGLLVVLRLPTVSDDGSRIESRRAIPTRNPRHDPPTKQTDLEPPATNQRTAPREQSATPPAVDSTPSRNADRRQAGPGPAHR